MLEGKICFIGYGNSIRTDDGLGPCIIEQLEKRLGDRANFTFITLHQTDLTLAPMLSVYDHVIFIDADADLENDVIIDNVYPDERSIFSSHVSTIPQLLAIMAALYNASPECRLVRVRGYEFGFGEELTGKGKEAAASAVAAILRFIGD